MPRAWAVLDPALGRTGAHHVAFAQMLARTRGMRALAIVGNASMPSLRRAELEASGAVVMSAFDVDFYAVFERGGGIAAHWDWIHALARQYVSAMEQVLEWHPDGIDILHPTLSWEHANALALAIRLMDASSRLRHVALLMFSPGCDETGHTWDAGRAHDYRRAFSFLLDTGVVELHASCGEYADAYRHLLDLAAPLPLHPCILGDWSQPRPPRTRSPGDVERVLMYMGEVKQDKGFLELPEKLRAELVRSNGSRGFVLHFTAIRTDAARSVLAELRGIAALHANVEIIEGFIADAEMERLLRSVDVIHLDYDPLVYAHKTSGVLWLAAWYGLAVVLPKGGWLEREGERLGITRIRTGHLMAGASSRFPVGEGDGGYFRKLFSPFAEWLATRPGQDATDDAASWASLRTGRPMLGAGQGEGADVVMLWKQNDSTLYGHRNDMIARYLASRPDVRRVLMVDAPISQARLAALAGNGGLQRHDRLIVARTLAKSGGRHDAGKLFHSVFVHDDPSFAFDEQDRPGAAFLDRYEAFLREEFAHFSIDMARALFWVFPRNFSVPEMVRRLKPARVVVDVVDDHRAWPGISPDERERLSRHYHEVLGQADLAISNCEPIQAAMRLLGRETEVVLNGCDAPLPVVIDESDHALREHLAFKGRVIGFVGNLEAKIDIDLLHRIADAFPRDRLVLIGSTHANPAVLALRRHPNVRMPGVVAYDQLGAWLSRFDVGLIPHLPMDLTRYMNPLKAYVYIANAIPVVASGVPNIEPVAGMVRVVARHDDFIAALTEVLDGPRPARLAFERAARAQSWEVRLSGIIDRLGLETLGARAG